MTQIESNYLLMCYIKYLFRFASREFGNNLPLSKKGHSKGSHYWSCSYQLLFQRQPCHREYIFFHSMIYTFLWGEWLSRWKFLNTGKIAYTFPNNDISIQNNVQETHQKSCMLEYLAQRKCQVHLQFCCYVCIPAPDHNLPLCRMVGSSKSHRILQAYDLLVSLAVGQLDLLIKYIIIIQLLFG